MTTNTAPLLTIDDLTALPDDGNTYELIEGELIVSSAPSFKHQRVIKNLTRDLANYLDENPIGEVVPTPGDVGRFFSFSSRVKGITPLARTSTLSAW